VLYEWAWALQELNQPDDAARLFERLRKEYPQGRFWADATCRLAQRAFDAKDYAVAGGLVDEVLAGKTDPKVREYAMFLRGQIAVAKTDWPKVREVFTTMLKEFSRQRAAAGRRVWIAEAYYRQADYAAAGPRLERLAPQLVDKRERGWR